MLRLPPPFMPRGLIGTGGGTSGGNSTVGCGRHSRAMPNNCIHRRLDGRQQVRQRERFAQHTVERVDPRSLLLPLLLPALPRFYSASGCVVARVVAWCTLRRSSS